MDWKLYVGLSIVMFLEYAIWGAWAPVLAARLLGPLKMSGKQTGWVYATLPLACIFAPLVAGQLADKYLNTELILAVSHLIGGVLLFIAARKTTFTSLFILMLCFSVCYAATLPLVNSMMFAQLAKNNLSVADYSPKIFIWAPIAWALVGYFLSGWRWKFKTGEQGRDCLYLAAILAVAMAVVCFLVPEVPPARAGVAPIAEAFGMLRQPNFFIFILVSMVIAGLMQFYFLGTARFMQDLGIPSKNVPASMAIAQAVQAAATFFLLAQLTNRIGYKWTLVVGACCWFVMYLAYVKGRPPSLIVVSQALHGLAYVFFIIAGQMLANGLASEGIRSSMQALVFAATTGLGLFLGTNFAGIVMDGFRVEGRFRWRPIFLVPCVLTIACAIAFILFFRG
jgi:nucleoside transporter